MALVLVSKDSPVKELSNGIQGRS